MNIDLDVVISYVFPKSGPNPSYHGYQTAPGVKCKRVFVMLLGRPPCMFGTGLLQTAGGRLLLSSFHRRDRTLAEHTQNTDQSTERVDRLNNKQKRTLWKSLPSILLLFFRTSVTICSGGKADQCSKYLNVKPNSKNIFLYVK